MVSAARLRLGFVSPIFLCPAAAGGKIRSTNILRGLKGGCLRLTPMGPATPGQVENYVVDLDVGKLVGRDAIGMRVGKIINQYKVAKHFDLTIPDTTLSSARKQDSIVSEVALDSVYAIRS